MTLLRSFNTEALSHRLSNINWSAIGLSLQNSGYARIPGLLDEEECENLSRIYAVRESGDRDLRDEFFHKGVNMERLGYGKGGYGYLTDPLPDIISTLQAKTYKSLLSLANDWAYATNRDDYPETLEEFHQLCAEAGQDKPACLLLQYPEGGYNAMHQDKYGPSQISFPFQMVVQLKTPGTDFNGGELVLSEEASDPRKSNRFATRLTMQKGEAVIFHSTSRIREDRVVPQYHGVTTVTPGSEDCIRQTAGIMWHQWGPSR